MGLSIVGCTAEELEMNSCNGGRGYYMDYAGSGVVHLLGAGCSLTGCIFMGARRGRFNKRGEPLEMPGHSIPLAGLGGFILIFGFLAFNGGSQSTGADGGVVALAIVNTILGASMGGLSVLVLTKFLWHRVGDGKWSFLMTLNGALAGMVAQCAGCNVYEPWAAMVIGAGAAFVYLCIHTLMIRAKLDDPLDAVAVHGGGGMGGLICVPFFMSAGLKEGERGIIFDGMKLIKMLRVSTEVEFKGMDIVKHGESAYPAQAWVEFQYNKGAKGGGKGPTNPVMAGSAEITGITTVDGNKKNIDGEVFNNPFQLTAPRNGAGGVENRGMAMERNGEEKLENCFANITQKLLPTYNILGS